MKDLYDIVYTNKTISDEARSIVMNYHYSKSVRSLMQQHVFELKDKLTNKVVGVAIYGKPFSKNEISKLELRKLALIDDTPKNTESYFIGHTLRWLKSNTDHVNVISFSDPNQGHTGGIYKATNFKFLGEETGGNPCIVIHNDRRYHIRQMYQKKLGFYSADAMRIQKLVNSGKAVVTKQKKKLKFGYKLR